MKWLFAILSLILSLNSFAQTDSVFWFAAPQVTYTSGSAHSNRPIVIRVTAYNQPAFVTISEPANGSFSNVYLNVPANSTVSYDLTSQIDIIESKPANQALNYGLLIKSTALITAYYEENSPSNPEMFVLKGNNALGLDFFIPAQNIFTNWGFGYPSPNPPPNSSFDIIATEDNTIITINPANDIQGHAAGITFTVNLNKGQVYSAVATSSSTTGHLMGSTVSSNKPIAITIKDDSIGGDGYSGCLDLAGDQIVPTSLVGTKYITLPGFLNDPVGKPTDHLFVLATQNNTDIKINGVLRTTINKGQTYHDSSFNQVKYIETSLPTYTLHLSGFGCEVGHALLPSIECTGSQKVAFTRSNGTNLYMNILVPAGYENNFTFNGTNSFITGSLFDTVPYTNGLWKYARIFVSTSQMPVGTAAIVANSGIEFHLSVIHGDGTGGARYGYFSDFNKLNVTASSNAVNGSICANSDLKFFTNTNNSLGVHFSWSGPNGFTSNTGNPILTQISTAGTGTYNLVATKFSCNAVNINIPIVVNPVPSLNLFTNAPICSGNNLIINATSAGASFNWVGANNFVSTNANNTITNATTTASGNYKVTATINNCSATDSISVTVNPTPSAIISVTNSSVCLKQNILLQNNNTVGNTTYNWLLPNGTSVSTQSFAINNASYADSGKYILTASTLSCIAKDSVTIKVVSAPNVILKTNAPICSGNDLSFSATYAGASFNWTGPNNFSSINTINIIPNAQVGVSGYYKVITTANNCVATDSIELKVNATPSASISVTNNNACLQQSILIKNNSFVNSVNYKWTLPNGSNAVLQDINIPAAAYTDTGKYYLTASTAFCSAKDSVIILVKPIPQLQFITLAEVCSNVAAFNLSANEISGGNTGTGVFTGTGVTPSGLFDPAVVGSGVSTIRYTYTYNNGCSAFKEQSITVNPTPVISLQHERAVQPGGSVQLNASISGNYSSLIWQDVTNTLSNINIPNPTATPIQETTYRIVVATNKNCVAEDAVLVRIVSTLTIPNVFSPNGDGVNDTWLVEDKSEQMVLNASIFDRYGKLVKTVFGHKIEWDGKYDGQPLPVATYYYVLTITKNNTKENRGGWIQLLR